MHALRRTTLAAGVAVWLGAPVASADAPPPPKESDAITVAGQAQSLRGAGDAQIGRAQLDASPRLQASELLSAAPGVFVDNEGGEGLGNDVYIRGFDMEHGSGIQFRLGDVPLNIPVHLLGPGYADIDFLLPEVIRGIHVQQGPFDMRQGDAALAGSVELDLGIARRGTLLKTSYGSFGQWRAAAVLAPEDEDEQTFAAFAWRHTGGPGTGNRAGTRASANGQYAFDLDARTRLKVLVAASVASSSLAGVIRQDDLARGSVGYFDTYSSPFAQGQSVGSSRLLVSADLERIAESGGTLRANAWSMLTGFRLRQNYTGNVQTLDGAPPDSGPGDLIEITNDETAFGGGARYRTAPLSLGREILITLEPGASARFGGTGQSRTLLRPDLSDWDRSVDAYVRTMDLGAYADVDARIAGIVHVSGGLRADALAVRVDDRLADDTGEGPAKRSAFGVAVSPRVTLGLDVTDWLVSMVSYGEGFRSLAATELRNGETRPFTKARSTEVGARAHLDGGRFVATLAAFQTRVGNELVFDPDSGGLEAEGSSVRRGVTTSVLARPARWALISTAFSVQQARFDVVEPGESPDVPNVPSFLFRADASAHRPLFQLGAHHVEGRIGTGVTVLGPKHVTQQITSDPRTIVNASLGARYRAVDIGLDVYNLLDLRYPDDEAVFPSNWAGGSGSAATLGRHISAAPPRAFLATVALLL